MPKPITHVLLDIEGTTCPVDFVANTLFPYAANHLRAYLHNHGHEVPVQTLLADVQQAWRLDHQSQTPTVEPFNETGEQGPGLEGLTMYLIELIAQDRKLPALKELQGLVWKEGYQSGAIKAPLFPEVAECLHLWRQHDLILAVYSSGSVTAQQLLYGNTADGDLQALFSAWFDTRTGPKQSASSYLRISEELATTPNSILFASDSVDELKAARRAGMEVIFSDRDGNPNREAGEFARITSLVQLSTRLLGRPTPG